MFSKGKYMCRGTVDGDVTKVKTAWIKTKRGRICRDDICGGVRTKKPTRTVQDVYHENRCRVGGLVGRGGVYKKIRVAPICLAPVAARSNPGYSKELQESSHWNFSAQDGRIRSAGGPKNLQVSDRNWKPVHEKKGSRVREGGYP
ncbi:hypothetical protein J6590_002184 [Homalodisca vitripennis]|nr:hypothetical protein J6590_002184 [Homalodisca vitripennis]